MDNLKQAGKRLQKNAKEAQQNTKRIAENIPLADRAVDSFNPAQSFNKEIDVTGHRHHVNLSIKVGQLQKPCELNPIDEYLAAETDCGNPGAYFPAPDPFGADGAEHPLFYDAFLSNIGGFSFPAAGGIQVPLSGIYNLFIKINFGSVALNPGDWISVSLRRNGFVLSSQIQYSSCGICAFFPSFSLFATGVYLNVGDVVGGWAGAISGLPFYTPSNLCGLFGGQPTRVELVAIP